MTVANEPLALAYDPAGHAEHEEEPDDFEKVPDAHNVQAHISKA
jgi:hypothetical protein